MWKTPNMAELKDIAEEILGMFEKNKDGIRFFKQHTKGKYQALCINYQQLDTDYFMSSNFQEIIKVPELDELFIEETTKKREKNSRKYIEEEEDE